MKTGLEARKGVLKKVYGGERKSYMHKYSENTGKCEFCGEYFWHSTKLMCNVITPEEVSNFKNYE